MIAPILAPQTPRWRQMTVHISDLERELYIGGPSAIDKLAKDTFIVHNRREGRRLVGEVTMQEDLQHRAENPTCAYGVYHLYGSFIEV